MDIYKLIVRFIFLFLVISMVESTPFWLKCGRSGSSSVFTPEDQNRAGVNISIVKSKQFLHGSRNKI